MPNEQNRVLIAERLLVACDIDDRQLRAWSLGRKGYTSREVGFFMGYGKSTICRWWDKVQYLIEKEEAGEQAEGPVLAGVTVHDSSNDETETPFKRDMSLTNLGF